jgi:hypothetical protein
LKDQYGGAGANGVANSSNGTNGAIYGAGASGAKQNSATTRSGGTGANGLVRLTYDNGEFLQFI